MKKLEYYEHNIVEDWYSDVYIIESGKMIKAPLIEMNGEELIKLNGNLYMTRYDTNKQCYIISKKYGLYRY